MNLRVYKKRAKIARDALIRDHGHRPENFVTVHRHEHGELALHTCATMDARLKDRWGDIHPLAGTPIYLPAPTDYWGEAIDPECCITVLREVIFWETCGESYARKSLGVA